MNDLIAVPKATEWHRLKALVLDSVSSPIAKRVYNVDLDEFIAWYGHRADQRPSLRMGERGSRDRGRRAGPGGSGRRSVGALTIPPRSSKANRLLRRDRRLWILGGDSLGSALQNWFGRRRLRSRFRRRRLLRG